MNKSTYSSDLDVNNFITWIEPKLSIENSFKHSYISKKPKGKFECNSIYSAYENYFWDKESFNKNQIKLIEFSRKINNGIENNNHDLVKQGCEDVLKWGGVSGNSKRGNLKKINELDIVEYLKNVKNHISIELCEDGSSDYSSIHCNSGFSKIYSSIVDNFIIYDSRVSCALCYLIRLYAKDNSKEEIPENLRFAYTIGRNENKNPSNKNFIFRKIYTPYNYLKFNIMASWLLKLILEKTKSKFNNLPDNIQLRALESALFMIGYKIN